MRTEPIEAADWTVGRCSAIGRAAAWLPDTPLGRRLRRRRDLDSNVGLAGLARDIGDVLDVDVDMVLADSRDFESWSQLGSDLVVMDGVRGDGWSNSWWRRRG